MKPALSARRLWLITAAVLGTLAVAVVAAVALVLRAVNSGAGWLSRHIEAAGERRER